MGYRSVSTAVAAVVLGATVMLAGCASSGEQAASTPSPSAAVPAPAPSSAPPAPTSDPASAITCDELLPASVRDGLAPGLTATSSSTPDAGSYAAQIAAEGGTVCQWTAAGGDTLSLAVARPSHDALTAAETGIGNGGTATTDFGDGVKAWTIDGGGTFTGDFEVFTEAGYWISTVSSLYTAPDSPQAKTVVGYVLQALPSS